MASSSLCADPAVIPAASPTMSPVGALLANFSIEALSGQVLSGKCSEVLPPGTVVYVPFLPGARFEDTVTACAQLVAKDLVPVPHLAARAIPRRAVLASWLGRLQELQITRILLIAGDLDKPVGPFSSTLDVLASGLLSTYGVTQIGIAGHPQGHPRVAESVLDQALECKLVYAAETGCDMWIVSQFAFTSAPVVRWIESLRQRGVSLPISIGLPGPAKPATLISYALHCGVGVSLRKLHKHRELGGMLLRHWYPETLLGDLARYRVAQPNAAPLGIHVFPFGGLVRSAEWFSNVRDGRILLSSAHDARAESYR